MKYITLTILALLISIHFSFGQKLGSITEYPSISIPTKTASYDWSEITNLKENGLFREAILKVKIIQKKAISEKNIQEFWNTLNELDQLINQAQFENQESQKFVWDYSQMTESIPFPMNNLLYLQLIKWTNNLYFQGKLTFNDESLVWNIEGKQQKLYNNKYDHLIAFYKKKSFNEPMELMKVASNSLQNFENEDDVFKNSASLFELIAFKTINAPRDYRNHFSYDNRSVSDSTYFGLTNDLLKAEGFEDSSNINFQLYYHIEQLCLKNQRLENYSFWVERRLNDVYQASTFEKVNSFNRDKLLINGYKRFEKFLKDSPSSSRFTYHIANELVEESQNNYHWKTNNSSKNNCLIALRKIDESIKTFPTSQFKEKMTQLKEYIFSEDFNFSIKGDVIKGKEILLSTKYRNTTSAVFKIYKVEKEGISNTLNPLKHLKVTSYNSQILNFTSDSLHLTHDKDFILPKIIENGKYLFITAKTEKEIEDLFKVDSLYQKKNHFAYKIIQVSSIQVNTKSNNGKTEFLITNSLDGLPIEKAIITLIKNDSKSKSEIYSNEKGLAYFNNEGYFNYTIKYKNDSISSSIYSSNYIEPTENIIFKTYTDRSIYRPSQTVNFKTISLINKKEELTINTDQKVNIKVKDQNGKTIWESEMLPNKFGSVSGSFILPQNGFLLGDISITVNDIANHYFKVEEYKRPTFEVSFNEIKGKIKLGDSLTVTGIVKAFAGYPISDSKIKLTINQNNYFPRWCDVHYNERNISQEIEIKTDLNGEFKFTFLPKKSKYLHGSHFSFNALVTDISGEVQEATSSIYIGNESYTISMDLDENLVSTIENKINIRVQNSQGVEKKEAKINYILEKRTSKKWYTATLEEAEYKGFNAKEFEKVFPTIYYFTDKNNEKSDSIATGRLISGESLDLNLLLKNQSGSYTLLVSTIDETGEKIVDSKSFNYISPSSQEKQHLSEFWAISTKVNLKLGDVAEILIGSSHEVLNVFVEHQNSLKETKSEWLTVKNRKSLKFPITEKEKNGFLVSFITNKNGKLIKQSIFIKIENKEKELDVKLKTIRDYLKPGSKEKWTVSVSDFKKNAVSSSELMVGMYDASLNQFISHTWDTSYFSKLYLYSGWQEQSSNYLLDENSKWYTYFSFHELNSETIKGVMLKSNMKSSVPSINSESKIAYERSNKVVEFSDTKKEEKPADVPRTNFNETAFFYPTVYADTIGNYNFEFTLPDALTKWQFMAFAHSKDLKTGYFEQTFIAKKEVMVEPNEPRFFREGDTYLFSSKVINRTNKSQSFTVRLKMIDPITEKDVSSLFGDLTEQKITINANANQEVSWNLNIPSGKMNQVAYLIEAEGNSFSDAEKKALPILSNRILISESKPFVKNTAGEQTFSFEKINQLSKTAEKISLSIEMQTQPLWTTLMSLPYLMEFPYESSEQTFARYFGNVLAQKILAENPTFKKVIESWKETSPSAFLSELEKNNDLKSIVLSETPWLMDAQNESEKRQHLAFLFDENNLNNNIYSALNKLNDLKSSDGGWSWFGLNQSNVYITQHIVSGFGQLKRLGIPIQEEIVENALRFLESEYERQFSELKKEDKIKGFGLSDLHIHWLIARSYFNLPKTDAVNYYQSCLQKDWTKFGLYTQALAGMSAFQLKDQEFTKKIKNSILDRATKQPEMGMYWNENKNGYYWNQSQVETQSALIEFFTMIGGLDKEVKQMQLWLLQQKRTNAWETTKSSTMACYALLNNKIIIQNQLSQSVKVKLGDGTDLGTLKNDSGSTFRWTGKDITPGKANLIVKTENEQPVFGAIHFQYLEDMDKVIKSNGDIRIERHFYIENKGIEEELTLSSKLEVGSKIKVKMTVTSNREMEFVHLKDSKASGFESRESLSGYHYSKVGYYQISKDASTEIFIDYLPKGSYTFEYEVFASGKGDLTVGSAIIECMYAPSFRANTNGFKFSVK